MAHRAWNPQSAGLNGAQPLAGLVGAAGRPALLQPAAILMSGVVLGVSTLAAFSLPVPWGPIFVLAALCPFVALIVGDLRRFLLAVVILDIPFQIGRHLDFRPEVAELGALGGLNVSVTTIALPILYALWIAESLTLRRRAGACPLPPVGTAAGDRTLGERPRTPLPYVKDSPEAPLGISLPLALYVGIAALSALVARDGTMAFFEVAMLFQSFLLYVYVASMVRTRGDVLFVVTMLLAGVVLESLLMLGPLLLGPGFSLPGFRASRADITSGGAGSFYRLAGTVGSPNTAAAYLEMLLAPAAALLLATVGPWHKLLAALTFGVGGLAMVGTFSRGGWLAFGLSVAIVCLLVWRRGWLSPLVPLAIVAGAALVGLPFQDAAATRLADQSAVEGRFPLMDLAFRMIQDRPLLGVGANNFAVSMQEYLTPEFAGLWLYTVHNKYLLVWAETGTVALGAFLLFLATTLRQGWLRSKSHDRFLALVALGFTAALVGQMVHMMFDIFNARPQVQLLWLASALIAALQNVEGRSRE